ncbi:hypothetical protein ACM66B_006594 [Microbotryomycetes sp. NB124-2]
MLPRIVPWSTFDEFKHVFELIFDSDGDSDSQRHGVDMIKVWMLRGNCPHAAESTAAFLELVLRDSARTGQSTRPTELEQRLGYSMALIRFVNSLIDPLQTTYYARSMATLATQIGLPLWFVELRHAATHEHLPTLVVLQDAAKQALDWLYTNYWIKTISGSGNASAPLVPLDDLRTLLGTYKTFAKTAVRDASQATKVKPDLQKCFRGIESWVGEAESMGRGRERAMEGLVEALVEVGALVPTAKKKRVSARQPTLSRELSNIWSPLISRLDDTFDGFLEALVTRMLEFLALTPEDIEVSPIDKTLIATYSAWILELVNNSQDDQLLQTTIKSCLLAASPNSFSFVETLTKDDEVVYSKVKKLVNSRRNFDTGLPQALDQDEVVVRLYEMDDRMRLLDQRMQAINAKSKADATMDVTTSETTTEEEQERGFRLAQNWKPCPIGMLPGGRPSNLDWQWWKEA